MRIVFLAVLSLLTFTVQAQEKDLQYYLAEYKYPVKDGVAFFEVIDSSFKGKTKDQLYAAAMVSFAKLFNNSKYAIKLEDAANGHIIGKGASEIQFKYVMQKMNATLHFTLDYQAKDGKYRLQLFDFTFSERSRGDFDMQAATKKRDIGAKVIAEAREEGDRLIEMITKEISKNAKASNEF